MKICSICETENHPEAEECILCGASLEESASDEEPSLEVEVEAPAPQPTPPPTPPPVTGPAASSGPPPSFRETVSPPPSSETDSPLPEPSPSTPWDLPNTSLEVESPPRPNYATSSLPKRAPTPWEGAAPTPTPNPGLAASPQPSPAVPSLQPSPLPPTHPPPPTPQIPEAGTLCLIVYFQRRPALYFSIVYDETLLGRKDPASNAFPDLDLTPFDPELAISRKHAYLYREGDLYYLYPISNSGTQLNNKMVDMGVKKPIKEGDVIILSGRLAIKFERVR